MKPIEFKEQNVVFAKDQKEYNPLPADELPTFEEDVIVSDGDDYWFGHRTDDKSVIIDNNSFAKVGKLEVKYWMPIPILSTCTKNEKI